MMSGTRRALSTSGSFLSELPLVMDVVDMLSPNSNGLTFVGRCQSAQSLELRNVKGVLFAHEAKKSEA